jgi:hypothetical protein
MTVIFEFGSRPTSENVHSVLSTSGLVEDEAVEIELSSQVFQNPLALPFLRPPSWISGRGVEFFSAIAPLKNP